jgi:bifunctional enzyme CysN/CysC
VREQFNLVVVGHVDHGKSTLIGRLLADTGSLPNGKLEQVRAACERNAKPFEYAFLLDALADEQRQGITIDTARCFFKFRSRDYIIIDAPGHIEFLKNMVSGAARAEAALLLIDALEGVKENSRRHGYMLSMLGIRQVVVVVNKMDLVNYEETTYNRIVEEYSRFLENLDVVPKAFIPAAAFQGENLVSQTTKMPWYDGPSLLDLMDRLTKEKSQAEKAFRFPVQDIYKFTELGDDRRIVAGRVDAGRVLVGDQVVFLPSMKEARITAIEEFNATKKTSAQAGSSIGFTVDPQAYIRPGEVMAKVGEQSPLVGDRLRVNIFWMGRQPMVMGRKYKLKIATAEVAVWLREINSVLDASDLTSVTNKRQIDLYDVADCVLETFKPIAFDRIVEFATTGRFVIVDAYEIAGGGIVLESLENKTSLIDEHIRIRERGWERTAITPGMRAGRYGQQSTFVVVTGARETNVMELAKHLEEKLFNNGRFVYFLGLSNALLGIQSDAGIGEDRAEFLRRLGEVAHLFTDAGAILVTSLPDLDDYELAALVALNRPNDILVVSVGDNQLSSTPPGIRLPVEFSLDSGVKAVEELLRSKNVLLEHNL